MLNVIEIGKSLVASNCHCIATVMLLLCKSSHFILFAACVVHDSKFGMERHNAQLEQQLNMKYCGFSGINQ